MMRCQECHSSITAKRYAYGLGAMSRIGTLCDSCAEGLRGLGMDLRESSASRRVEDRRPAWVRNLRAKDMTGGLLA